MPKKKRQEDSLLGFKPDEGLDSITRAAAYLIWASKNFPRRPIPLTYIVKYCLNEPKVPSEAAKDVQAFRINKLPRLRSKLLRDHHKGLVYHPGIGYRCTVDDDDIVENVVEKKRSRVQTAIAGFTEAESIVNPENIKSGRIKNRFDSLTEASRRLNSPGIRDRLAPPPEEKADV